jgi:hypothetical protein
MSIINCFDKVIHAAEELLKAKDFMDTYGLRGQEPTLTAKQKSEQEFKAKQAAKPAAPTSINDDAKQKLREFNQRDARNSPARQKTAEANDKVVSKYMDLPNHVFNVHHVAFRARNQGPETKFSPSHSTISLGLEKDGHTNYLGFAKVHHGDTSKGPHDVVLDTPSIPAHARDAAHRDLKQRVINYIQSPAFKEHTQNFLEEQSKAHEMLSEGKQSHMQAIHDAVKEKVEAANTDNKAKQEKVRREAMKEEMPSKESASSNTALKAPLREASQPAMGEPVVSPKAAARKATQEQLQASKKQGMSDLLTRLRNTNSQANNAKLQEKEKSETFINPTQDPKKVS